MSQLSRKLIILQGDDEAITKQLTYLSQQVRGDWIVISEHKVLGSSTEQYYLDKQTKSLLGREFKHAIFDARLAFNLDALAILAGTLVAESLLIIILPNSFNHWYDQDSLRWSELPEAILVPNFITHLHHVLVQQAQQYADYFYQLVLEKQQHDYYLFNQLSQNAILVDNQETLYSYQEQQSLLTQISKLDTRIIMVTAKRGRGKSALAGYFTHYHHCWVTAPNKNALMTFTQFATTDTLFFAPDELISQLNAPIAKPDWLIIDEAAMIPLPMVVALINGFKHVLLTSTTDGYEGTGQGLLLKLLNQYQSTDFACFQLHTPIRWLADDPVEYFVDSLIVSGLPKIDKKVMVQQPDINFLQQSDLVLSPMKLSVFFGLLKSAHYRTTLIDLRRLLDAHNLSLYSAEFSEQHIAGVLVAIKEGGLTEELALQILKGYRRPKGNLVAQSLVAHAGEPEAAQLRSIRVNRIAVCQTLRRQGIARSLLTYLIEQAKVDRCDFVSASFAYSAEVYQFWMQCGFHTVHVGTHKEASSGSYAVMVIYPLSSAGSRFCNTMRNKLTRNWYWLQQLIDIDLPINISTEQTLNSDDKLQLLLFATTSYAYTASFAVLYRLFDWLKNSEQRLEQVPILTMLVTKQFDEQATVSSLGLSGKSQLLKLLRQEIYQFIKMQGLINE